MSNAQHIHGLDEYDIQRIIEEHGPIPTHKAICPGCGGEGHHLPDSLSGDVTEMCAEDEEFEERYFQGGYDVTCTTCHGKNVVDAPNYDVMPAAMREAIEEQQQANEDYRRERESELRWGC